MLFWNEFYYGWLEQAWSILTKNVLLTKSGKAVNSNTSDAVVVIMGSIAPHLRARK
jgi:N-acetylneuraminic acid mutarotase